MLKNPSNLKKINLNLMHLNIIDKIGIVNFNNANNNVNVINHKFSEDLKKIIDIYNDYKLDGLIFKSDKKNNFIAGADINMLTKSDSNNIDKILDDGHKLINTLSNINSVSAIHGSCLGGGLEFALACKYRIVTNSKETILGLPEVKLGLLPGMGGTQLFPELVGLKNSLSYMLSGSNITSKKAHQIGLADYIVDESLLDDVSLKIIKQKPKLVKKNHILDKLSKPILLSYAKKKINNQTNELYPAPYKILNILDKTYANKRDLKLEKDNFLKLLNSYESKSLIKIFNNNNKLKDKYRDKNVILNNLSIIGCGLMGTGIAKVSIANINTLMSDNQIKMKDKAVANLYNYLDKSKKISKYDIDKIKLNINTNSIEDSDIVIEAVSEDMSIKEKVFKELDKKVSQKTVLASNTSSLSINEISKFSKYPERVIGMHYFSPVEKMPLLEIIKGKKTNKITLDKALSLGKKQNKTMIVVKDVPGFYINRCLTPYMNEALHLLMEGYQPSKIDKIMTNKGFPVGPFTLMDEVGLDICSKVNQILKNELDNRIQDTELDITKFLLDNNSLGKKNKKGFYLYKNNIKKDNQQLLNYIKINNKISNEKKQLTNDEIFDRLLYKFINECHHCLYQDIIEDKSDGDIGAIFGTGFPPYLGGPFEFVNKIGKDTYYNKLSNLNEKYNGRYNFEYLFEK